MIRCGLVLIETGELVRVTLGEEPVPEYDAELHDVIEVPESWLAGGTVWDNVTRVFVDVSLARAKAAAFALVNRTAERLRGRYLTAGEGQAMTYIRKEAEARAWGPEVPDAQIPFLAAEAAACGMAVADLVAVIIGQADGWVAIGSAIEARRRGLLTSIEAATSAAEVDAIDITEGWPT